MARIIVSLGVAGWVLASLVAAADDEPPREAGRGAPWKMHVIDDSSRGADGVRLADVNGDGRMDVATGWEQGGLVRVCINPGPAKAAEKWPGVTVGKVASPEDAVLADLDGDGAVDVVSLCEGKTRSVFVHWAPREKERYLDPAAWKTEAVPALKGQALWMFCLPMQVDGKGGIDLVIGAKGRGASVGWLQSPKEPRDLSAWKWHAIDQVGWVMALRAEDVDGDGDSDVVVTDRKGPRRGCRWLENPGPGPDQRRRWKSHAIGAMGEEVMFLDLLDGDGDGKTDVLVPTFTRKLFFLRRKSGAPPAWGPTTLRYPRQCGNGKAVRAADLDLDGKLDFVLTGRCDGDRSGIVWLSQPKGFAEPEWDVYTITGPVGPKGYKPDRVELLDLDGDGDLDVMTTEERARLGVVWYENPTRRQRR